MVLSMRFGVLGPLAVWTDDGDPVTVPGLKVRALLADLLVHEGRPVSTDRLVEDLWGEQQPANPAGALQVRVSQLRRALREAEPDAHDLLVSRPPGYLLRVEPEAVDARRFASLAERARASEDPRVRAGLLADALALWRGPAFADFADDEFARSVVTRLEEQRLAVLEEQAEARLELGEHSRLAGELAELMARHPLRERLRAAQMLALYRAGRQTEALESYADLRTRLADELGLDPSPGLVALHRSVLEQDPALEPPPVPAGGVARPAGNLPSTLTELIGRDDLIAEVRTLLADGRLVTLTGSGGVGKTRLAVQAARQMIGDGFPDGVWLVELAAADRARVDDPASSPAQLVATVLDIRDDPGQGQPVSPTDRLADALRDRRLLLVLDNCEHVVEPAAELADRLLRAAPGLRILATSREPLGLAGEMLVEVPPLAVPDPAAGVEPAQLERSSAVRLFVARAAAASRGFTLDADTAPAVALLCRRLDGIPLALELAATRVRALGVPGLVARLDDRFRLLATGQRGVPRRQQTLTAMIGWSWDLLNEPERVVLRRLAVHADGCTLEAAEAVCAGDDVPAVEVPDLLARLVDRSLVVMTDGGPGPRYRLLESVAAYCLDRIQDAGEFERLRHRHADWYTDLAVRAEPELRGPGQREWLRRLDADAANLRTALDGAVARGEAGPALRLSTALVWYWYLRGRLTDARRSLRAALDAAGEAPAALRARATAWHAGLSMLQGGTTDWAARRDEALSRYAEASDPGGLAMAQWFLGVASADLGDLTTSAELVDRALANAGALGDRWVEAAALSTRAKLAHVRGDLATIERDAERGAELFRELGDGWGVLQATEWLGGLAEMTGDLERAARLNRDGLRIAEELGLWAEASGRLSWLGWIAMQTGGYAQAREHCERAMRLAGEHGLTSVRVMAEIGLGFAARRAGNLDRAAAHLGKLLSAARAAEPDTPVHLSMVLSELGFVAELRGDAEAAAALHAEAFGLARQIEAPRDTALALEGLAGAVALAGRPDLAARLSGAAAAARRTAALPLGAAEQPDIDRVTAALRTALGESDFAVEFEQGGKLSPDRARALVGGDGQLSFGAGR
jgi:predicted ATPase/DNA-binding SARP family transcriptional activator